MKITMIGSGSWGTALAHMLAKNGRPVTLWSFKEEEAESIRSMRENVEFLPGISLPEELKVTSDIQEAADFGEVYITAVPSKFVRTTLEGFAPHMKKGAVIINVAKGLEENRLLRLSEVIEQTVAGCRVAVLSGPSHAEEVARELPTTCVAAAKEKEVAELVQDIFMCPSFRVYLNMDLVGVELGGALKNVIALAAGITDGLGFGDNTKAALMTRGNTEIARLGMAMGANAATFSGLAGIGDLIVTCTSMHSRNRRAGILLGQGKSMAETLNEVHMVVEGINTARSAYELSLKYKVSMPITAEINKVLFEDKSPRQAVVDLMGRDKTQEHCKEDLLHMAADTDFMSE